MKGTQHQGQGGADGSPCSGCPGSPSAIPLGVSIQRHMLSRPLIDDAEVASIQENKNESGAVTPLLKPAA